MTARLETERLLLRPFEQADLDAFAELCADPEVMRFIGTGRTLDREDAWRAMALYSGHWTLLGYGQWALVEKATGLLVGRAGLWNPEGWPGLEAGWLLRRSCWGQGFATEAGRAVLDHAFRVVRARHVISLIYPENTPSIRVAERLGERLEGTTVLYGSEVCVYGIPVSRWQALAHVASRPKGT
jgi:RimJ/RimL family protein N-acetyltransferase